MVAEIFNNFFINIIPNLKILNNYNCDMDFQKTDDPVLNAINKYRCHLSIVMINSKIEPKVYFLLQLYNMMMVSKKLKI